jgi:GR25 family glycosyltransferase involved in LPS biosynthesis
MQQLFDAPAFVINLDRRPDRWAHAHDKIRAAGFQDVRRFKGIDAENEKELTCAWNDTLGEDTCVNLSYDSEFATYKGKHGILLSQVRLWKHIIDQGIPIACVFEDDVLFHSRWKELSSVYFTKTPTDWDVLFMGSQLEFASRTHIDRGPVFCLHAYCLTLEGAHKLYNLVMRARTRDGGGIFTIDTMLKVHMETANPSFNWYVWNGAFFPDPSREMKCGWTKRNQGLVFQDVKLGSDVRHYE